MKTQQISEQKSEQDTSSIKSAFAFFKLEVLSLFIRRTSAGSLMMRNKKLPPQCSNDRLAKRVEGSGGEKCDHADQCESMQGCYKYHSNSMFNVSKTYFTGVNLGPPSENVSPQLVSQAAYEHPSIPL